MRGETVDSIFEWKMLEEMAEIIRFYKNIRLLRDVLE